MKKITLFSILILLFIIAELATAAPTTAQQAKKVVQGWLKADMRPLGAVLGRNVIKVETFSNDDKKPVYHVVYLQPSGFVIVPADDLVEPIIGFADDGTYDPSINNPLGALVSQDLPGRIAAVQGLGVAALAKKKGLTKKEAALQNASLKAQSKWSQLQQSDEMEMPLGIPSISDECVAPIVQSKWSQSKECGEFCYNYYTPNNYVCGCVATALAQLIRYHEHPDYPNDIGPYTIWVDGSSQDANLIGGPYNYNNMPLDPDCGTTLTQRQDIGTLCYDAGVAVNMQYSSSGSGAYTLDTADALVNTFNYSNSIKGNNLGYNIGVGLNGMLNPNLDAGYPCLLGITGPPGGHAIVADGYGYDLSDTLYHHLNMGWAGNDDAWYNLPNIDIDISFYFNTVYKCVYNTYKTGSGEIISGRITDEESGEGISDVMVTVYRNGNRYGDTTTNNNGIFALAKVPSNSNYTVYIYKYPYDFIPSNKVVNTGTSAHYQAISGNCWGIDFKGNQFATIRSFPYTESFESGIGDWRHTKKDDMDWTWWDGPTPSYNFGTGPNSACDGAYYLYTESSGEGNPYKEAILNGPYFDLSWLSNPELRFCYHMYGATMGTLTLEVTNDKGATWDELWSLSGNQGDSWYEAVIDLSAYNGSTIRPRFVGVTGSIWLSDMAIDNITVAKAGEPTGPGDCITSYPYIESFEDGLGDWINKNDDDIDWSLWSGPTPSSGSGTGPLSAVDGAYYMYTESTYPNYPDKDAILEGPCFDLNPLSNPELRFYYHMYGTHMGDLSAEISDNNGVSWNEAWSLSGNQGDSWYEAVIDLSAYSGSTIKVRFVGITGSSFTSDMAIDYVTVAEQPQPGDFYPDGYVNFVDLVILCEQWLQTPSTPSADIAPPGGDGFVDFMDFALFANNWME